MSARSKRLTPILRQYLDIKKEYKDALLLFRVGDFYEMFYDDAVAASRTLKIPLITRDKYLRNPVPMCGIPRHALGLYVPILTRARHMVVFCEQIEDSTPAKVVGTRHHA